MQTRPSWGVDQSRCALTREVVDVTVHSQWIPQLWACVQTPDDHRHSKSKIFLLLSQYINARLFHCSIKDFQIIPGVYQCFENLVLCCDPVTPRSCEYLITLVCMCFHIIVLFTGHHINERTVMWCACACTPTHNTTTTTTNVLQYWYEHCYAYGYDYML